MDYEYMISSIYLYSALKWSEWQYAIGYKFYILKWEEKEKKKRETMSSGPRNETVSPAHLTI